MSGIKIKFDAVVARKYQKRDGSEGTQWINVGRAVEWNDGGLEVELTSIPVGDWWNGKVKLFVQKDKQQPKSQAPSGNGFNDDPDF